MLIPGPHRAGESSAHGDARPRRPARVPRRCPSIRSFRPTRWSRSTGCCAAATAWVPPRSEMEMSGATRHPEPRASTAALLESSTADRDHRLCARARERHRTAACAEAERVERSRAPRCARDQESADAHLADRRTDPAGTSSGLARRSTPMRWRRPLPRRDSALQSGSSAVRAEHAIAGRPVLIAGGVPQRDAASRRPEYHRREHARALRRALQGVRPLCVHCTPGLPLGHGRPGGYQARFRNLIDNAAEAMQRACCARCASRRAARTSPACWSSWWPTRGPGVTDEMRERLFLPYFSTKQPRHRAWA